MDELALLKPIIQRKGKNNSVPRAARYWLFFKRHILEQREVRERFEQQALNQAQFRQLFQETLAKTPVPSFCRPRGRLTPQSAERNMREMLTVLYRYYEALLHPTSHVRVVESERVGGLGACARQPAVVGKGNAAFADHLWGVPFEVSDDNFKELQAKGYPSLYRTSGRGHILAGPLALVNHRCGSPLVFSMPRKTQPMPEEFGGMPVVLARATRRHRVPKDDELEVDYFAGETGGEVSFADGECKCHACV